MEIRKTPLHPGKYYHIFNRGVNGMPIFFEKRNYDFFLRQYSKYLDPYVETLAYCLLKNHFHMMIRVKSENKLKNAVIENEERTQAWHVSNGFSSFFQSYTKAINKVYNRTGPLFESPFKRIEVTKDSYYTSLIAYIHRNPQKHGIVKNFHDYKYSSYNLYLDGEVSSFTKAEMLNWFGGRDQFIRFHEDDSHLFHSKDLFLE